VGLVVTVSCTTPGAPPDGGAAPDARLHQTPPSRLLRLDFEGDALGSLPADWIGVRAEMQARGETLPAWLYDGTWEVARVDRPPLQGQVLRQTQTRPEPWVSLVRYRGGFFGPDGKLPMHYRFEVTQQPVSSPYNLPPTGDQGVQPYYLDADHYLEVVNTPGELRVWVCDGGQPMSARGWKMLFTRSLPTRPGDARRVGGIVDVARRTFVLYYDGKPLTTLQVPDIDPTRPHFMALRSLGNEVNFDDLEVEKLD
jgi:hypothetical protein